MYCVCSCQTQILSSFEFPLGSGYPILLCLLFSVVAFILQAEVAVGSEATAFKCDSFWEKERNHIDTSERSLSRTSSLRRNGFSWEHCLSSAHAFLPRRMLAHGFSRKSLNFSSLEAKSQNSAQSSSEVVSESRWWLKCYKFHPYTWSFSDSKPSRLQTLSLLNPSVEPLQARSRCLVCSVWTILKWNWWL